MIIRGKTMRIHSLEHEPFEGLANIEVWAKNKGHKITRTLLYRNEKLPAMDVFDWLITMGGSMNIYGRNQTNFKNRVSTLMNR